MFVRNQGLGRSLALRAAGLLLLAIGLTAIRHLFHMAWLMARHDASPAELALAALGFMSLSAGAALTVLGAHIFDQVELSERWARRSVGGARPASPSHGDSVAARFALTPRKADSVLNDDLPPAGWPRRRAPAFASSAAANLGRPAPSRRLLPWLHRRTADRAPVERA